MSRTWHHDEKRFEKENWIWNEPKKWRREMKHVKRRREVSRVLKTSRDWDGVIFPLDKKPWRYYW